ncbi:MAG: peptidylprolyl isomerase [Firmicutes bacterium]|nr:peptidylprolyl isomerase [Bacillota bacterium]
MNRAYQEAGQRSLAKTLRTSGVLAMSLALVLGLWSWPGLAAGGQGDGTAQASSTAQNGPVVVTVNGDPITQEQFYQAMEERVGKPILDLLITEQLIRQEAAKEGVTVTPQQVDDQMAQIRSQFPSEAEYQAALAQNQLTPELLRYQVEMSLLVQGLSRHGVTVTDQEVTDYFNANHAQFDQPAKVRVRHILVDTEQEAQDIEKALTGGADFAALAKEKSQDPGTKDQGGELGWITQDQVVQEFGDAAFKLKVGEISQPVKTQFGYHILQVEERQEAVPAKLAEVADQIRQTLLQQKSKDPQAIIDELKAAAKLDFKWARYADLYTAPAAQAPPAEGSETAPQAESAAPAPGASAPGGSPGTPAPAQQPGSSGK